MLKSLGRALGSPIAWLITLFLLVVPWLELWLMFRLDQPLLLVVLQGVATAAVGWWFARSEDLSLWTELESDIQNHRVPTEEALDAMLTVLGGWGLIVPGWITDVLGAALLVPAVRRLFIPWLRAVIHDHLI
jgi:UPF0716 protein FxsA